MRYGKFKPTTFPLRSTSGFEKIFTNAASLGMILAGFVAFVVILHFGQPIMAPVALAVVIGLMFGPLADRLESMGIMMVA